MWVIYVYTLLPVEDMPPTSPVAFDPREAIRLYHPRLAVTDNSRATL